MNNKKGFTLIEIIITLGLILLITGVAIGSFVGISKQKKKEEWALVKGQIETAAEQYFSSNKYLFEGLSESVTSTITTENLVNNNYLNKVINPITGSPVDKCSFVEVKYENGKFIGSYKEESNDCSSNNNGLITIMEPGAVDGEIEYYKADDNFVSVTKSTGNYKSEDNWWNATDLGAVNYGAEKESLKVCIKVEKGKSISGVEVGGYSIKNNKVTKDETDYYCVQYADSRNDKIKFMIETNVNNQNRKWVAFADIYVDTVKPTNTVKLYKKSSATDISSSNGLDAYTNNTWFNGWVFTEAEVTDSLSGVNTCYYSVDKNITNEKGCNKNINAEKISSIKYKACDKAGNCTDYTNDYTVKLDRTKPDGKITISKKDTWYSKNVSLAFEASDNLSGLSSYNFDGVNQITTDKVGNTTWGKNNVDYTLSGNYTDANRTKTLTANICDVAGNCNDKKDTYTLYQQCSSTTDNGGIINKGTCNTCGATTTTATQPTVDNNLGVACSRTVTVSCTPSCAATSVAKSYCNDSGHHTMKKTGTNCCSSDDEEDCGVKAIQLTLNNNDAESGDPKGMGGSGPDSTNGGRIFNRPDNGNTTGAHTWTYSTSGKRGMNVTVGWNNGNLYYAGASCMNVGDFPRRFKYKVQWSDNTWSEYRYVSMPSNNTSNTDTKFTGRKTSLTVTLKEDTSKIVLRYGCSNDDNINVNGCGSSTGATPNVTTHTYYIEYGGIKSNRVTLYTKYFANCGY